MPWFEDLNELSGLLDKAINNLEDKKMDETALQLAQKLFETSKKEFSKGVKSIVLTIDRDGFTFKTTMINSDSLKASGMAETDINNQWVGVNEHMITPNRPGALIR